MDINDLLLNENAYFYIKSDILNYDDINSLFEDIVKQRNNANEYLRIIQKNKTQDKTNFIFSALVYSFEEMPVFISDSTSIPLEFKYGYLLIIEYDDFIIVNRKNVSGLNCLYKKVEELDYKIISRLFITNKSLFEKFHMKNMDISDSALRNRTLEALNLRNSLPLLSSNRYVLSSMRVANENERISLSFGTSRINRIGKKRLFKDLLKWTAEIVFKIKSFKFQNTYLDLFPSPLDYKENIINQEPLCILFVINHLLNKFENGKVNNVYYKLGNNKKNININTFLKKLQSFERFRVLKKVTSDDKQRKYSIDNTIDKSLQIKINDKSITINAKRLKKIIIDFDEYKDQNLVEYLNYNQNFIINFLKPDIIYFNRKLFLDNRLLTVIDSFLSIFIGYPDLTGVKSEKGELTKKSTKFSTDSIFSFIEEKLFKNAKTLVCDDLGNEWADFIAIKDNTLSFCHAKHSESQLSASDFHDVVGQAQKNLGNFFATENEWRNKVSSWDEFYCLNKVESKISRIRIGSTVTPVIDEILTFLRIPNSQKEVWIVIDYISKKQLSKELNKLKTNPSQYNKPQVVQLLWFLSSLISTCKEFGVNIFIACKP